MGGPNRTEWPFPKNLFPTMPGTLSPGAGDGPHSNSRVSEEGLGGSNDFLPPEEGAEEARRRYGKRAGGSGSWSHGPNGNGG